MAAAIAAIRAALGRIGFSIESAEFLTNVQGFNTLEKFMVLTDDEVDHLGSVLRKPGGTIQQGPNRVTHPGFSVSYVAIKQLKLMNYYLRFMEKTSRVVTPAEITEQNILRMMRYREWEEDHKDPEEPELSFKDTQWARTIETLEEYFHNCLGPYVQSQDIYKMPMVWI